MIKRTVILLLLACFLALFPLAAANVSVLVMETGLPREGPSSQYSEMWENGLMDVLFEMGHIVSNAPILRVMETPSDGFPGAAQKDYNMAIEGGMGYFFIAIVNHPSPRGTEIPRPLNVNLRLFNTKDGKMLQEQKYTDKSFKTEKEEYENIKMTIANMTNGLR